MAREEPAREGRADQALTRRGRQTRANLVVAAHEIFRRPQLRSRCASPTSRRGPASRAAPSTPTSIRRRRSSARSLRRCSPRCRRRRVTAPRGENVQRDPVRDIEHATRRYFECVRRNARIARSIEELQMREPGVGTARRDTLIEGVKRIERWIRALQERGHLRSEAGRVADRPCAARDERERRLRPSRLSRRARRERGLVRGDDANLVRDASGSRIGPTAGVR